MIPDFAAFILTHGRPNRQRTLRWIQRQGYTGPVYLVVDDEDETLPEYQALYGDQVIVFSKREAIASFDIGDNFVGVGSCIPRNAIWDLAENLGYRYFIMLDDDYTSFRFRWNKHLIREFIHITDLDTTWGTMLNWFKTTPPQVVTFAMSQGGDFIGGTIGKPTITCKRKAMNAFFCDTQRRFEFPGRLNEDVNAYTELQRRGFAFLTTWQVSLEQEATQQAGGGMTETYREVGTYVKSFYSVMRCPSAVRISYLRDNREGGIPRIHHRVNYDHCAPKIIPETLQKKAMSSAARS